MTWALIRISDNAWLDGPLDEEPQPGDGERVVEVALGYPDKVLWSPALGGFVDVVTPAPASLISRLQFQRRFTLAERIAIRSSNDPVVIDYRELGQLAEQIDLNDEDVIVGLGYLEQLGLIGQGRAAEILAIA